MGCGCVAADGGTPDARDAVEGNKSFRAMLWGNVFSTKMARVALALVRSGTSALPRPVPPAAIYQHVTHHCWHDG